MKYKLHQSVIDILETLRKSGNPESEKLIIAVKKFVTVTPIDFGIIKNGAYRTAQEQNALFNKKPHVTNCDGFIHKSFHQSGLAVKWGGDWGDDGVFEAEDFDPCHFELEV